jgi:tripartite-type tricarboxylate transporter receptor subunit TctC
MRFERRKFLHTATAALTAAGWPGVAGAADYPTRTISIVVPFAAGGATDVLARVVAESVGKSLGQTIIVENVTGAAGSIGVARVARAGRWLHAQYRHADVARIDGPLQTGL